LLIPVANNGILRGLGETDSWKKPEVENLVTLSPLRIVCWGGDPVPDTCEPGVAGQAQADQHPPAGHQPQARQAEGAPGTN
jgi:hypothetical protein